MLELAALLMLGAVLGGGCVRSWRLFRRVREAVAADHAAWSALLADDARDHRPR